MSIPLQSDHTNAGTMQGSTKLADSGSIRQVLDLSEHESAFRAPTEDKW
jgi:hypothetical protein